MNALAGPAEQCRDLLSLLDRAAAGLEDRHVAVEPMPGTKTAGWLLGHLAVTGDFALRLCGHTPLCPPEWRALFNPGTHPSSDPAIYPPIAALRDTAHAVYARLSAIAPDTEPARLAVVNPYAPARSSFPTAGGFVGYLLSGHLAYHLGQLVAWRAVAGVPTPGTSATQQSPARA
ncbi:MAG TPA: DinB family protein [Gemmatimonadaceae bacterium]|nr:DinB family protein [Gemmatimonadaceae bacterium]